MTGSVEVAQLLHQLAVADGLQPELGPLSRMASSSSYEDLLYHHADPTSP
jgi:hypothetical protein